MIERDHCRHKSHRRGGAGRFARGAHASIVDYAKSLGKRDALINAFETFLGDWDALLCPVSLTPAVGHIPFGTPLVVDGREVPYFIAGTGLKLAGTLGRNVMGWTTCTVIVLVAFVAVALLRWPLVWVMLALVPVSIGLSWLTRRAVSR